MEISLSARKDILDLIKRRVSDLKEGYRQNIALLGSQHVGKSTILQHFISSLDDSAIIPVYIDLESHDIDHVITKTIRSILYYYLKSRCHPDWK